MTWQNAFGAVVFLITAPLFISPVVFAHDHTNLERGIPIEIEDAYPTAFENREFQGILRTRRTEEKNYEYELVPILEYGFIRNGELELAVPVRFLPGENNDSGNIELEALYNFNFEGLLLPAFSLKAGIEIPTGMNATGWAPAATLLVSKTLSRGSWFHALHLNAAWLRNSDAGIDERLNRYRITLGYELRLDPNNMVLMDLQREQQKERKNESNLFEIGLRHQWNPLTVLAIGTGVGFSDESPDFRATLGFQRSITIF